MGVKALTYVEPTGQTRAERWAKQDEEARRSKSDDSLDSMALGYVTGVVVGPKSMVGSALCPTESRSSSDTSYDSGSSDTGSSSSDSGSSSSD